MNQTQEFYYQELLKAFKILSNDLTITNYCKDLLNDLVDSFKPTYSQQLEIDSLAVISDDLKFSPTTLLLGLMNGINVIDDEGYIVEDEICGLQKFKDGWGITTYLTGYELLLSEYCKTWSLSETVLR